MLSPKYFSSICFAIEKGVGSDQEFLSFIVMHGQLRAFTKSTDFSEDLVANPENLRTFATLD